MVPVCRGADGSRQTLGFRYTDEQKGELDEPDVPRANRTTSIETACCSSTRQGEKTAEQDLTKVLARKVPGLIRTKRPSARRTSASDKRDEATGTTDRQDERCWNTLGNEAGQGRERGQPPHDARGRGRWARRVLPIGRGRGRRRCVALHLDDQGQPLEHNCCGRSAPQELTRREVLEAARLTRKFTRPVIWQRRIRIR